MKCLQFRSSLQKLNTPQNKMILRSGKETLCLEQVILNPIFVSVKSIFLVQKMIDQLLVGLSQIRSIKNPRHNINIRYPKRHIIIHIQYTGDPRLNGNGLCFINSQFSHSMCQLQSHCHRTIFGYILDQGKGFNITQLLS